MPLDGSVAITVVQFSSGTQIEVPRTLIDSKEKLDGVVAKIEAMQQRQGGTDPDSGIDAATDALKPYREDAKPCSACPRTAPAVGSTTSVERAKTAGIERFSVIGIDDFGNTDRLREYYGPYVYGGGAMTIARNTVEFASLIAGSCFGDAVTLRALEVNQGAQDWHNSKTLLQARETIVRAFVETPSGAPDERVTGRLIGRRDGVELPGSPLVATNTSGSVLARNDIEARRGDIDDSLNFELPFRGPTPAATSSSSSTPAARRCTAASRPMRHVRRRLQGRRRRSRRRPSSRSRSTASRSTVTRPSGVTSPSRSRACRARCRCPPSTGPRASSTTTTTPSIDDVNDDLHRMREVERTSCGDSCGHVRDIFYGLIDGGPLGGLNGRPTASRATRRRR